jgi:hypothetical protein
MATSVVFRGNKLLRRRGDEQFGVVILRQRGNVSAAVCVKVKRLFLAEIVVLCVCTTCGNAPQTPFR